MNKRITRDEMTQLCKKLVKKKQKEIAEDLGVTQGYISIAVNKPLREYDKIRYKILIHEGYRIGGPFWEVSKKDFS